VSPRARGSGEDLGRIVGVGAVLGLYLAQLRVKQALELSPGAARRDRAANLAAAVLPDSLYAIGVTLAFGLLVWLARGRPAVRRLLGLGLLGLAGFSVLLALANLIALRKLGQPLSYQWLYYSDFLTGLDAYNVMAGLLSWSLLGRFAAKCAAVLCLGLLAGWGLGALIRTGRATTPLALGGGLLALALPIDGWLARRTTLSPVQLANPVVFLVTSAWGSEGGSTLASMRSEVGPDDFLTVGQRAPAPSAFNGAAVRAGVRNVILFVMESVPSRFLGSYGGPRGLTPELDRAAGQARIFTDVHAHVPSTVHSLVSLLLSTYPPHSLRILTREYPRVRLPSLSSELTERGYRDGFFNSADNRFQRSDEFLAARGFETVGDHRSLPCARQVFIASDHDWPFSDGTQDGCTVTALLDWAGRADARPFAAVMWTMQTHYPYFVSGPESRFAQAGTELNRYLSALHERDRALGDLLRGLERRELSRSTLVVVLGDHGEAFGEHAHTNHQRPYEEDLHIPLLLINPVLFHGERDSTPGGIIDVAPTVLDLLGLALPARWQGRSLFDPERSERVYFFAPFSSVFFGVLDGSRKLIFNATANTAELYDLARDPGELENLAPGAAGEVSAGRQRLTAWARYQEQYYTGLLNRSAR
jgi:arylsulfatase A-like enzyme